MKYFVSSLFKILFTCLILFSFSSLQGVEKLLLHMDVNKTLIAVDPASNQTKEQILNAILAEKYTYKWAPELKEAVSYQTYVEDYLLPGPSYDQVLKKKRRELINQFVSFLQKTHHPLEKQVVEAYHELYVDLEGVFIFPSFLKLIEWLKVQGIQYRIILRTFGNDLDAVVSSIAQAFPGDCFVAKGYFEKGKLYVSNQTSRCFFENFLETYLFLKSVPGHLAIRDNWIEWHEHHESREYGKKFPIDLEDKETLSLFFDDNVKDNPDSPVNIVDPIDVRNGKHLNISQLIQQKIIFRVNTFQAIIDENYFIDLMKQSLEARETILNNPVCK